MEARKIIIYLSLLFNGDWDLIYKELKEKTIKFNDELKEKIEEINVDAITILDSEYPSSLKKIDKPPFVLFYKGNKELINSKSILAVIGSRNSTNYGENSIKDLFLDISKDIVIVSGLAKGIDKTAHKEALKNNLKTIAVLGCSLNYLYPKENQDVFDDILNNDGLIISEYYDKNKIDKNNFLFRNRVIAGLANSILLIESYGRSGALSTCNYGLTFGKNIACVPNQINKNSNCNKLIKDGAYLIETSQDINNLF